MANPLQARVAGLTRDASYASQLSSIISELALSEADSVKIFSTIDIAALEGQMGFMKALAEISRYEGFNPRQIIQKLLRKHGETEARIAQDASEIETCMFEVDITEGNTTVRRVKEFSNNMQFNEDMQMICLMFITRGAAFEKIERKSTDSMKKIMRMLKVKYDINITKRRPGTQLDSEVITIPRIAASFPNITVGLFHMGFGRSLVDATVLFPEQVLPRALFSPMIASILPKGPNAPLALLLSVAVRTDDILHQQDAKTNLTNLHTYLLASYNSTATTELVKMKACEHRGIGTKANGVFSFKPEILACVNRAKEVIRSSRPNDPSLEQILSTI